MEKEIAKLIKGYVGQGMTLSGILDEQLEPDDPLRQEYTWIYNQLYPPVLTPVPTPSKKRGQSKKPSPPISPEPGPIQVISPEPGPIQVISPEPPQNYLPSELRDYQRDTVAKCQSLFVGGGTRCFIKLPTGAGKTRIMYKLIDDDYAMFMQHQTPDSQLLVKPVYMCLSPRISLADQHFSLDKVKDLQTHSTILRIHTEQSSAEIKRILDNWCSQQTTVSGPLIISGLYQSIARIRTILAQYPVIKYINLLFADEAHMISLLSNPKKIGEDIDARWLMLGTYIKRRVFMSATPTEQQTQNQLTHQSWWGAVVNLVNIRELIQRGILCPIETIIPNVSVTNTSRTSEPEDEINSTAFCDIIYKSVMNAGARKCIVFCNTQQKCRELFDCFSALTPASGQLGCQPYLFIGDGFTTGNIITHLNNDSVEHKKRGDIVLFETCPGPSIVFVCRKISMGYDFPPVDFIAFADPKCSAADLAQCIGRGLRSAPGKTMCRVLIPITPYDYANNTLAKRRHNTLFQYLLYIQDEVGFEYKIPDSDLVYNIATGKPQPSTTPIPGQPSQTAARDIITFVGSGLPNINYIDLARIYVILDIKAPPPVSKPSTPPDYSKETKCRDMSKCFFNGQRIRHRIGKDGRHIAYGVYSAMHKLIKVNINDDKSSYMTLNDFAKSHYKLVKPDRQSNVNAWRECEMHVCNNIWTSIYSLPELSAKVIKK